MLLAIVFIACVGVAILCILSGSTEDAVGVICLIALVGAIGTGTALFLQDTNEDERREAQVQKVCGDYRVTNLAYGDDTITFDCANDGRLRVVR